MKRSTLFLAFIFIFQGFVLSSAQKIGVIDSDYLLKSLPEYKEADQRFNEQIQSWQRELATVQAEYDKKKELLENERVLLVGEQLKSREREVSDLEKKLQKLLKEKFTAQGEINTFRAKVMQPFQDKVWAAIKSVAEKNSLGIILDKNNSTGSILFTEKRYDYTQAVLNELSKGGSDNKKEEKKDSKKKN